MQSCTVQMIYPKERKRTLSDEYVHDALVALKDYKHWGIINRAEYCSLKSQIKRAESDDAVANIMTRLRHKVYG